MGGRRSTGWLLMAALLLWAGHEQLSQAAFDLSGPRIDVRVVRHGKELPISQVPNLLPGDRLWLHPEMPDGQSVRYLLIVAFLRGPTNPPPDAWFTKAETWSKSVREEGVFVTVPEKAEQALLFLAPVTGGDFTTLRNAVQGRPGAFVRAAQDLNQAALDRSRIDAYFAAIKETSDPKELHERSVLLAHSLELKLNKSCFDKPSEQQIPCLTAESSDLVLNDGHSQSMVAAITSGPSADLIGAVTSSPMVGGTYYSYLGVFFDLAHLMDNLHTAQYQYIPALGVLRQDGLDLKLNNPPSFHKPKSVLVATLPTVETARPPALRVANPKQEYCVEKSPLVVPVEGAPLVYSTGFAHDFSLLVKTESGKVLTLPAVADPAHGGFVVDTHTLKAGELEAKTTGTLRGQWGFGSMNGPSYFLRSARPSTWTVPASDRTALILGREDTIHLQSDAVCCVDQLIVKDHDGKTLAATWKAVKPEELELKVPLGDAPEGDVAITVKQFGLEAPDHLEARTYTEAARLDSFSIHAGDREGVLQGERLDQVEALQLDKLQMVPAGLTRAEEKDELHLTVSGPSSTSIQPGEKGKAHALLKDGRVLSVNVIVEPPRPALTLLNKVIDPGEANSTLIHLGNSDELPLDGRLWFVVKSKFPAAFPRDEKIEVATEDQSAHVLLSIADGSLTLQDAATVLARLDPLKGLGPSTFGTLRFRALGPDGTKGDWQPLVNVVRLPSLQDVRCMAWNAPTCTLDGTNLFLIDSVATDPDFTQPVAVPVGFAQSALEIPHPEGNVLYLRLRDDPTAVSIANVPVLPAQQTVDGKQ